MLYAPLISPAQLTNEVSLTEPLAKNVAQARQAIADVLDGHDDRLLVVVGPCSIHDPEAALEYANLLKQAASIWENELLIVMRVYFEKPRSTIGWKGLINDPLLDGSYDINHGLKLARKLLIAINALGLPAATEFLDTMVPHYLMDLIAWSAIGARTSGSQIHREMASGLPMPVGFKNSVDGNIKIAVDGVQAAAQPNNYVGMTREGVSTIITTRGNKSGHIILRGSNTAPNYTMHHIEEAVSILQNANLPTRLMVDCSHGNSMKDNSRQRIAAHAIIEQIKNGSPYICGAMLESNLVAGNQALETGKVLEYGKSITDACISWDETKLLLEEFAAAIRSRRA